MQNGDQVRIVAGPHQGTTGEFVGEGLKGVSVKLPNSSIILPLLHNEVEPISQNSSLGKASLQPT